MNPAYLPHPTLLRRACSAQSNAHRRRSAHVTAQHTVLLCFPSGCCMKMTCFSSLKSHQSLTQLWHQSPSCTNRPQIIFAHYICSSDIFKTNFSSFAYLFYLNFPLFEFFLQFWFEISFYLDIHFLIQYVLFYIIEVHALLLSFLLS